MHIRRGQHANFQRTHAPDGLKKRLANTKAYTEEQVISASQAISKKTWDTPENVSALLKPGIGENEVTQQAEEIFRAHGIEKKYGMNR